MNYKNITISTAYYICKPNFTQVRSYITNQDITNFKLCPTACIRATFRLCFPFFVLQQVFYTNIVGVIEFCGYDTLFRIFTHSPQRFPFYPFHAIEREEFFAEVLELLTAESKLCGEVGGEIGEMVEDFNNAGLDGERREGDLNLFYRLFCKCWNTCPILTLLQFTLY